MQGSPDVGKNLSDHLVTPLGFDVRHDSLFTAEKPWELVKYLLRRRGMLTSNVGEAYGFVRSRPDLELADLELIFAPAPFFDEGLGDPYGHAVVCGPVLVKPYSRGTISLSSPDPTAKPIIDPHYLSDPGGEDRAAMMSGLRITAKIAAAPALNDVLGQDRAALGAHDTREETLRTSAQHLLAHAVSPGGHLPDGKRRVQRGGSAAAGARRRGAARGRRVGDADDHPRPHPRARGADR